MLTPERILNNLKAIDLGDIAVEAASLREKELVELQQVQMSSGIRGDDKRTGKYKSNAYVSRFKKGTSSLPYRDYFLTGEFYKEMFVKAESGKIFFGSFNEKTNFLEKHEENKLFGLSGSAKENEIKVIKKSFVKLLKDAITQ